MPGLMRDEKLIVFLKAPRPGQVKMRLAATLGAAAACAAYRRLVETLLRQIATLKNVELRFTPDDAESEIKPWMQEHWQLAEQGAGDLGRRLDQAFQSAFRNGSGRVVIIGSDCPEVTAADIESAYAALLSHDVVVGPAVDGGYWLIGLRAAQPALFIDMPWSTSLLLRETLERSRDAALRVHFLRTLSDVDTEADWRRFLAEAKA